MEKLIVKIDDAEIGFISSENVEFKNKIVSVIHYEHVRTKFETFLETLGWLKQGIDSFNQIVSTWSINDQNKLLAYCNNRTITLSSLLNMKINIINHFCEIAGIENRQDVKKLFSLKWDVMAQMGDGEAFLSLILKDGNKLSVGDVGVGDKTIELKGYGAVVKGQRGFETGAGTIKLFREYVISFGKKSLGDSYELKESDYKKTGFNVLPTRNGGIFFKEINNIVTRRGAVLTPAEKEEISRTYSKGMALFLPGLNTQDDYTNSIIDLIPDDCLLSKTVVNKIHTIWFKWWMEHYKNVESFDYFGIFNSKTNEIMIFDYSWFLTHYETLSDNKIIKYTYPSLHSTERARAYGIFLL